MSTDPAPEPTPSAAPSAAPSVAPPAAAPGELPDDATVAALRALAADLAVEAGRLVREGRPERVVVAATKSSAVDPVTEMDRAVEELLRARIAAARPDDAILGEEGVDVAGTSGLTWVVDPIDGTVNYLYGVASYAVSVAVVAGPADPARWTALAGAVHSVVDGRTWTAARGQGATCDGRALRINEPQSLGACLVGTGFGYAAARRAHQARVLTHVLPRVRDIRRLGSAAIDLCLLAEGGLDLYYERGLNPWDLAAGALVAAEAGAAVTGLRGEPAGTTMAVAGAAPRVAELVRLLEDAGADGPDQEA
ncbi:inositol monophosphatase family protein [Isoptericola variabilis]|uniref:Inositol-1-monophosphatase n=1 Tax=Isoptericola variabilis (strain 225) TaxID=743718 RepID=F6FWF9_ISOV2|nr:inositol monophosphatase family protein [Isoptericola variabilis]AEG44533.1 Inositol-phosphate phosphatase [Isoptericola variabilis 225]TWH26551.1 myo-inositol-1(or 4)-monophosphatase [Isoptericola variabilis J7]